MSSILEAKTHRSVENEAELQEDSIKIHFVSTVSGPRTETSPSSQAAAMVQDSRHHWLRDKLIYLYRSIPNHSDGNAFFMFETPGRYQVLFTCSV